MTALAIVATVATVATYLLVVGAILKANHNISVINAEIDANEQK